MPLIWPVNWEKTVIKHENHANRQRPEPPRRKRSRLDSQVTLEQFGS